jgi:hypothetical protein
LETSIFSYEKGFYLKNDYYNGINLAFLMDLRASLSEGADAIADAVLARRIRARVLKICEALLTRESAMRADEKYWVLATMAEAHVGLGEESMAQEPLKRAGSLGQPQWMTQSTEEQLARLKKLLRESRRAPPA